MSVCVCVCSTAGLARDLAPTELHDIWLPRPRPSCQDGAQKVPLDRRPARPPGDQSRILCNIRQTAAARNAARTIIVHKFVFLHLHKPLASSRCMAIIRASLPADFSYMLSSSCCLVQGLCQILQILQEQFDALMSRDSPLSSRHCWAGFKITTKASKEQKAKLNVFQGGATSARMAHAQLKHRLGCSRLFWATTRTLVRSLTAGKGHCPCRTILPSSERIHKKILPTSRDAVCSTCHPQTRAKTLGVRK